MFFQTVAYVVCAMHSANIGCRCSNLGRTSVSRPAVRYGLREVSPALAGQTTEACVPTSRTGKSTVHRPGMLAICDHRQPPDTGPPHGYQSWTQGLVREIGRARGREREC